jgi:hypothetical protein
LTRCKPRFTLLRSRLLARERNVAEIDGIFEADLVPSQSFEVIGAGENVIVLRDASGFDCLLTVTCKDITRARTAAIEAARQSREAAEVLDDDELDDFEDEDEDE